MKVYVPTNQDYLEIDGHIIKLEKLKTMFIDFDRGIINYELWVETNEIKKLPGPFGNSDVIYTTPFDISMGAKLCMVSMMGELKNHRVSCFVKDSSYVSPKHCYIVRMTVNYKKDKMAENFKEYSPFLANRHMFLDFD